MATCAKCKRQIWWKKNRKTGNMVAVDPVPDAERGTIIQRYRECESLAGEALQEARREASLNLCELHTNHFATCGKVPTAPA